MRRAIVPAGLCAAVLLLGGVDRAVYADQSWKTYHSTAGKYSISYPPYWIKAAPPSTANDILVRAPDTYAFVIGTTLRKVLPKKQWNAAISSVIYAGGKPRGKITYGRSVVNGIMSPGASAQILAANGDRQLMEVTLYPFPDRTVVIEGVLVETTKQLGADLPDPIDDWQALEYVLDSTIATV
jgi:hypothetical protein